MPDSAPQRPLKKTTAQNELNQMRAENSNMPKLSNAAVASEVHIPKYHDNNTLVQASALAAGMSFAQGTQLYLFDSEIHASILFDSKLHARILDLSQALFNIVT